jgi:hypothetical protein
MCPKNLKNGPSERVNILEIDWILNYLNLMLIFKKCEAILVTQLSPPPQKKL